MGRGARLLNSELRGSDLEPLTLKAIRQESVDKLHVASIAAEITLAHHCLVSGTEYIQR
ncbi:MAG: hypothetical protein ISR85_00330 [Kiritimatiellales bacterium]|nr:hypothetical protein [Kiritimatiellota bacterium]MBL7011359.1 hypothetical protein [Kiritimatiellales bacterium]